MAFHGIRIEGSFDFGRSPQWLVLAHQATCQFMGYVRTIAQGQGKQVGRPQRLIEFVIDGKAFAV